MNIKPKLSVILFGLAIFLMPYQQVTARIVQLIRGDASFHPSQAIIHPILLLIWGAVLLRPFQVQRMVFLGATLWTLGVIASSLVYSRPTDLTLAYILMGPISFILCDSLFSALKDNAILRKCFTLSFGIWASLILVSYFHLIFIEYGEYVQGYRNFSEVLIYMRFPSEEMVYNKRIPFYVLIGSANKTSNIIILWTALVFYLVRHRTVTRLDVFSLGLFPPFLFVCFSRGAFLVSFLMAMFFTGLWWKTRVRRDLFAALVFALPALASVTTETFRQYWLNRYTIDVRGQQVADLVSGLSSDQWKWLREALFGFGVGGYGEKFLKNFQAGTHNLFLDIWADAGILGLVGFSILLFPPTLWSIRNWINGSVSHGILTMILISICALGFREFAMSYLFISNIGAIMAGLAIAGALGKEG